MYKCGNMHSKRDIFQIVFSVRLYTSLKMSIYETFQKYNARNQKLFFSQTLQSLFTQVNLL